MKIVKQKTESALIFSEVNIGNRALNLAYFEMIGGAEKINKQLQQYEAVNSNDVQQVAKTILKKENESSIYYCKKGVTL